MPTIATTVRTRRSKASRADRRESRPWRNAVAATAVAVCAALLPLATPAQAQATAPTAQANTVTRAAESHSTRFSAAPGKTGVRPRATAKGRTRILGINLRPVQLQHFELTKQRILIRSGKSPLSRSVVVERRAFGGGRWSAVDRGRTEPSGWFDVYLVPAGAGSWHFRLTVAAHGKFKRARAPLPSVTLAAPPSLGAGRRWDSIAAGGSHTCAIDTAGRPYCWGQSLSGALGNGSYRIVSFPTTVSRTGDWSGSAMKSITAGGNHTCALARDAVAYCWGEGRDGQLGGGKFRSSRVPRAVTAPNGVTFTSVSAGASHTCGIGDDRQVYCWGLGADGRLGDAEVRDQPLPTRIQMRRGHAMSEVAAGGSHSCALDDTGGVWCWGGGQAGQLGNGRLLNSDTPVRADLSEPAIGIVAGDLFTCALLGSGSVMCWGDGARGQLGTGLVESSAIPVLVAGLVPPIRKLDAGATTVCATNDFTTWCWGGNSDGQVGNGTNIDAPAPQPLVGMVGATSVTSGGAHSCSIAPTGRAFCWGSGATGQLGNQDVATFSFPNAVADPLR